MKGFALGEVTPPRAIHELHPFDDRMLADFGFTGGDIDNAVLLQPLAAAMIFGAYNCVATPDRTDNRMQRLNAYRTNALHAVTQFGYALALSAMVAAKEPAIGFEAVTDNANPAVRAGGRQRVNCAFETVERMGLPGLGYLKGLVVVVAASFTRGHDFTSVLQAHSA
jgi:hypothetical protein